MVGVDSATTIDLDSPRLATDQVATSAIDGVFRLALFASGDHLNDSATSSATTRSALRQVVDAGRERSHGHPDGVDGVR